MQGVMMLIGMLTRMLVHVCIVHIHQPFLCLHTCSNAQALDASADGYGRSEGCVVMLLGHAHTSPQNPPLAFLMGSAVNQAGQSSALTAPNGPSQQRVLRAALAGAACDPVTPLAALQLHGTGTVLGDPIEVGACTFVVT